MAYSTQTAVSDGTLKTLPLSIDYLDRNDISVYFNNTLAQAGVVWSWVGTTDKIITFTNKVPQGTTVTVKRSTAVAALYHSFSAGAQFTAGTLDESLRQTLLVAQEFSESSSIASDDMPLPVGSQAAPGKSTKYARADHVHVGMTGGSVGSVTYDTLTGNGAQTAFPLSNTPVLKSTTQVFIDSVYQNKSAYSLSGNTITFDEAPASGAVVEVITITIGGGKASDVQVAETSDLLATNTGGNVQGALQWLAATALNFIPGLANTVTRTVKAKLLERVSVLDFGADPTGVLDSTVALQKARDYIAAKRAVLVFPQGTYKYTVSPNWAIYHSRVEFEGEVRLRYVGTGDAVIFDASASDAVTFIPKHCYGVKWGWTNRPIIEAMATSANGVYCRAMHHCKIGARVAGCGTNSAALRTEFAVCSEFDIEASGNVEGWFVDSNGTTAIPQYGYNLGRRNPGETTSYCTFVNPIVEGPKIGCQLEFTLGNVFLGGTFEACTQYGVYGSRNSSQDKFYGTDFEVNTTADVYDMGTDLLLHHCDTYTQLSLGTQSVNAHVIGGRHAKVLFDTGCKNAVGRDFTFDRFLSGTANLTDAGTGTLLTGIRKGDGTMYMQGTLAFAGSTIQNAASGVLSVTVTGARLGDKVIAACSANLQGLIMSAYVTAANNVNVYLYNPTGAAVTIPACSVTASALRGQ